jgi:hypothetical protein
LLRLWVQNDSAEGVLLHSKEGGVNVEIGEILKELEFNRGIFPRKAVQEAIAKRGQITPELLRILKQASRNIQELESVPAYMAHIYAMYLLAQFREKQAYPLIVDFFSIPGEVTLDVTGDVVTEDLGRILASVSHGDMDLMKSLIENEKANEYVRNAALQGLLTLVARGVRSRDEVMNYYQSLFRKLARKPSHVWSGLVSCCTDLSPEEAFENIEQAFEDGLVDEMFIDLDWVKEHLTPGKTKALDRLKVDRHHTFIDDTVREMEWWACFDEPKERRMRERKVGRNDPCPCGSGKKYKHCCGSRR